MRAKTNTSAFILPKPSPQKDIRTLQIPHATVHSSLVAEAWLAWQSMHRSMMWLRQMAQLSTTMSQAQSATAFHCTFCQYDSILASGVGL